MEISEARKKIRKSMVRIWVMQLAALALGLAFILFLSDTGDLVSVVFYILFAAFTFYCAGEFIHLKKADRSVRQWEQSESARGKNAV
jgi:hypothetical protein